MNEEKIRDFLSYLRNLNPQNEAVCSTGLLIEEDETAPAREWLISTLCNENIEVVYSDQANPRQCFTLIVEKLTAGREVLLVVTRDPGNALIELLDTVGQRHSIREGDSLRPLPRSARLAVTTTRDCVERTISFPRFYELFGPIVSLSEGV